MVLAAAGGFWGAGCGGDDERFQNCKNTECCTDDCSTGSGGFGGGSSGPGGNATSVISMLDNFGDAEKQTSESVAFDSEGNFYVTGFAEGTFDIGDSNISGGGNQDFFIAKFSPVGEPLWAKTLMQTRGSVMDEEHALVTVASDNNPVIAGRVFGDTDLGGGTVQQQGPDPDLFVAKLDKDDGDHVWVNHFAQSASAPAVRDIAAADGGYVYVVGELRGGGVDLPDGSQTTASTTVFAAKINNMGEGVWTAQVESTGFNVKGDAIGVSAARNVAIGGSFANDLVIADSVTLISESVDAASPDMFLVTYDDMGTPMRSSRWGSGTRSQHIEGIDFASNEDIVIAGRFSGEINFDENIVITAGLTDGFVAKLDPDLEVLWATHLTGSNPIAAHNVAVGPNDEIAVIGEFLETLAVGNLTVNSRGNEDIMLLKLDAAGDVLWGQFPGGKGGQFGLGVAVAGAEAASPGAVAFCGHMTGNIMETGFGIETEGPLSDIVVGLVVDL